MTKIVGSKLFEKSPVVGVGDVVVVDDDVGVVGVDDTVETVVDLDVEVEVELGKAVGYDVQILDQK